MLGIILTQVQDLALNLAELHEAGTVPPLQPVQVPLNAIPSLQHGDHTTELGVASKHARGTLNPPACAANKDACCRPALSLSLGISGPLATRSQGPLIRASTATQVNPGASLGSAGSTASLHKYLHPLHSLPMLCAAPQGQLTLPN